MGSGSPVGYASVSGTLFILLRLKTASKRLGVKRGSRSDDGPDVSGRWGAEAGTVRMPSYFTADVEAAAPAVVLRPRRHYQPTQRNARTDQRAERSAEHGHSSKQHEQGTC